MPIKKLTVSFDLPIATFLSMLAAGNAGMKIDVFGDEPKQKRLNGHAPKLLEGPKPRKVGELTSRQSMLKYMVAHRDRGVTTKELKTVVVAGGLSKNSASPQLDAMMKDGHVKRTAKATYQVTAKGVNAHG